MACTNWPVREKDEVQFKIHRVEADQLEEGRQKDDWTRAMLSALSFTAWKSESDVINRPAAKHLGKHTDE